MCSWDGLYLPRFQSLVHWATPNAQPPSRRRPFHITCPPPPHPEADPDSSFKSKCFVPTSPLFFLYISGHSRCTLCLFPDGQARGREGPRFGRVGWLWMLLLVSFLLITSSHFSYNAQQPHFAPSQQQNTQPPPPPPAPCNMSIHPTTTTTILPPGERHL